eukprot:CAMPEP_0172713064 /NCGR_PEP_ID=MMETSP1074-20121228/61467_1 /TAXON_ID=2916 /ORGANISM="Ceratium fusus, Strain PA161109" /LENGTH=250 /DNA_ID=CAMNT_0013537089 /DNA_START=61 /DNA_END=811 /DNA_ORIENTATION=-
MVFCCKAPCDPHDSASTRVRIDAEALAAQEAARQEQEAEAERLRAEEQQRMLEEDAAERARIETERRLREEAMEQARLAEEARLREEERLRQEEEARRAAQAKKERQDAINEFCITHRFNPNNLNEPKQAGCTVYGSTTTYALHHAAFLGDAKMVEMMLEEHASPLLQNKAKKTAAQVAQKKNKDGSHDGVLQVLRNSTLGGDEPQPCMELAVAGTLCKFAGSAVSDVVRETRMAVMTSLSILQQRQLEK